jgi:uncharacterized protein (DUF58 family)
MQRGFSWIRKWLSIPHSVWQFSLPDGRAEIVLQQPVWLFLMLALAAAYLVAQIKVIVIGLFSVAGVFFLSWIWAVQMAHALHAERKLHYAAKQVGDEMEETIRLWNECWLPVLWIQLQDASNFPHYSIQSVRWLGARGKYEWRHRQICLQRGVFNLGPWSLLTSDPLGIFLVQKHYSLSQQMVVLPPLAQLHTDLYPHGRQQGDLRPLNQPVAADSILSTQARLYQPGDPLSRVHWRTTARHNRPYVKVFDPEAASRIWLVPDMDPDVQWGSGLSSSEETLILLMSALASDLLTQHRAVGLFASTQPACIVLPQQGSAHLMSLLSALAPLHTTQPLPFAESLAQAAGVISPRDLVITATPSLNQDWLRALAELTRSRFSSEAWAYMVEPTHKKQTSPGLAAYAAALGIHLLPIHPADIHTKLGGLGSIRRWEFITTGTGKVVLRNTPRQASLSTGERVQDENG